MGGGKDRARRKARERYERQQQARLERQRKMRQRGSIGLVVLVVIGLVVGGLVLFSGKTPKSQAAPPKPTVSPSATTVAEPATHCTYTKSGTAARTVSVPSATPDYTATFTATIHTNRGNIVMNLLNSKATCTVNSFVHLAEAGFWNQSQCHRISDSQGLYMLQCGDPNATATTKLTCAASSNVGTGGPGYGFASENLTGATYPGGTVAMANSGTADSNGSQFFLVFKNTSLPAQYTPFGTISSGLDILQNVAKAGTSCTYASAGGGAPKDKVIIDSVTIKQT